MRLKWSGSDASRKDSRTSAARCYDLVLTYRRLVPKLETTDRSATGSCVHIITRSRLTEFWLEHPDASVPLREWIRVIRRKSYRTPLEVRADFPRVDFIGPRRAVFDVGGNRYRLIVDMRYDLGRVYIRHVVTHAEYDRLMKRGLL